MVFWLLEPRGGRSPSSSASRQHAARWSATAARAGRAGHVTAGDGKARRRASRRTVVIGGPPPQPRQSIRGTQCRRTYYLCSRTRTSRDCVCGCVRVCLYKSVCEQRACARAPACVSVCVAPRLARLLVEQSAASVVSVRARSVFRCKSPPRLSILLHYRRCYHYSNHKNSLP